MRRSFFLFIKYGRTRGGLEFVGGDFGGVEV